MGSEKEKHQLSSGDSCWFLESCVSKPFPWTWALNALDAISIPRVVTIFPSWPLCNLAQSALDAHICPEGPDSGSAVAIETRMQRWNKQSWRSATSLVENPLPHQVQKILVLHIRMRGQRVFTVKALLYMFRPIWILLQIRCVLSEHDFESSWNLFGCAICKPAARSCPWRWDMGHLEGGPWLHTWKRPESTGRHHRRWALSANDVRTQKRTVYKRKLE